MPSLARLFPLALGSLDWSALAIEISLKATLLLGLAAIANGLLRHRSAALRHWVWCTALVAVLLLPAALFVLPDWSLRGVRFPAVAGPIAMTATSMDAELTDPADVAGGPEARSHLGAGSSTEPAAAKASLPPPPEPGLTGKTGQDPMQSLSTSLIPFVWFAGVALVLVPMVVGRWRLRRLTRHARPLGHDAGLTLAQEAVRSLGVTRRVALLESKEASMPMSFGIRRPCVMLPATVREWPRERLRAVLLHEMAHVRRWDCLTQMLAQLACAVLWFHPGVWYASRCLRIERERACDDYVLNAETRASEYAEHLLDVVRSLRDVPASPFGAVAFARPSQFEGRLLAVLDPRRRRNALRAALALRIGLASCAVFVALAALKPWVGAAGAKEKHRVVDAKRVRLVGGASEVVRAPDPSTRLEARWAWAQTEAGRRGGDYWVGYMLPNSSGQGDGVLSDTEGIDLDVLGDGYRGPTLDDVLAGRSAGGAKRDRKAANREFAVLLHFSRGPGAAAEIDRIRAQTLGLPAAIGRQPLFWLGESGDEQSIAWLRQMEPRLQRSSLRGQLVSIISLHRTSAAVVPYLRGLAESHASEEVRVQAIEGLARHPSQETLGLLTRTARGDRSQLVRREAVEALGELDMDAAADVLIQIARSRADREIRTEAVEALGQRAAQSGPAALEALAEGTPAQNHRKEGAPTLNDESEADADVDAKSLPSVDQARFDSDEVAVQRQAVESLGRMDEAVSLRRLTAIAKSHPVAEVRREAIESIGHLGTDGALATLLDVAWKNRDLQAQLQAVESLQHFPEEKAMSELMRIARSHPRWEVRRQAVESLGHFTSTRVMSFLDELARRDASAEIQRQAIESFGHLPDEAGLPALERLAKTHPDPRMRQEAIEALAHRGPDRALPLIEDILARTPRKR